MTDLELAAAVRAAIAHLRDAPSEPLPRTRAALDELATLTTTMRPPRPAPRGRPIARLVAATPSPHEAAMPRIPLPRLSVAHEERLERILCGDVRSHETIEVAFRRIEAEVAALFAELDPLEARALHQRLGTPVEQDPLASRFSRLTLERRTRLLAYLADARRRAAQRRGVA